MDHFVNIKVMGVGGGGTNIVSAMLTSPLPYAQYQCIDTDHIAIQKVSAGHRLLIIDKVTRGYGTGADPMKGKRAILGFEEHMKTQLKNMDMVILIGCLGGGTGSGVLPSIAKYAKEMGILTITFMTLPFPFEGKKRSQHAQQAYQEVQEYSDSLITISNQQLLYLAGNEPITEAFQYANAVVMQGVQAIYEIIHQTDYINVDFADVTSIFKKHKKAFIGVGHGCGKDRIVNAVHSACKISLLETDLSNVKDAIVQVCGSCDVTLDEINEAFDMIKERLGNSLDVIFGMAFNDKLQDEIIVTIISTGD